MPKKCDEPVTTGRQFKQDHSCTLDPNHKGEHYCNVCGHSWKVVDIGLTVIYDSAVPKGTAYLLSIEDITNEKC